MIRALFIIALSLSQTPLVLAEALGKVIKFDVGYVEKKSPSNEKLPQEVLLRMPLIVGNIFGLTTTKPVVSVVLPIGEKTELNLAEIRETVKKSAAPLTAEALNIGFVVKPEKTKIARLSTLIDKPSDGKSVGSASFYGDNPEEKLMLVYFDRPCKLTGLVQSIGGVKFDYNVGIKKSGFYFLKFVQQAPSDYKVSVSKLPRKLKLNIEPAGDIIK